jgi:ferredoxin--NADP+ reductase
MTLPTTTLSAGNLPSKDQNQPGNDAAISDTMSTISGDTNSGAETTNGVEKPATQTVAELQQRHYNATIVNKTHLTDDLIIIRVLPDEGVHKFTPGQYVALGLVASPTEGEAPKLIKRAYSIGSSPDAKDFLEFYIAIVTDGALTPSIKALKEGDKLFCAPKITGHFTLEPIPSEANLILISTGTGIAPFVSMITTPSTWEHNRRITIIHGVRYLRDLGYRANIEELQKSHPNLHYFPVVSREDSASTHRGYVQDLIQSNRVSVDPTTDHVLLCGNPAMITDVETLLVKHGFIVHSKKTPGNLHHEKYW